MKHPPELVNVQDMLTEMSKTVAEQSKTMAEQTKLSQPALAELKDHQGAAANVVQAQERYGPKGGRRKGEVKGGGKGTAKGPTTGKIEFPANTMCDYVDQGKTCPKYNSPDVCPYLHPEDGMDKNHEKEMHRKK